MEDETTALVLANQDNIPPVPVPVVTETKPTEFRNEFDIGGLLQTAGQVHLSEKETEILYASVQDNDVEIRPDGLIYLPWMEYVTRLRKAFGMEWSIIPQGLPKLKGTTILWGFYLIVRGSLMGYAIGEQEYYPNNYTMSYSDTCEGAKSNALMRLCKGVGISLELWKPAFIRGWKDKYAETYKDDKGKNRWRKRNQATDTVQTQTTQQVMDTNDEGSNNQDQGAPLVTNDTSQVQVRVAKVFHDLLGLYNGDEETLRAILDSKGKNTFKTFTLEELVKLEEQIIVLRTKGCNGDPTQCKNNCMHFDSKFTWCDGKPGDGNFSEDLVCPYSKKGD